MYLSVCIKKICQLIVRHTIVLLHRCDVLALLDSMLGGTKAEKNVDPNLNLCGFEVINLVGWGGAGMHMPKFGFMCKHYHFATQENAHLLTMCMDMCVCVCMYEHMHVCMSIIST